jgi:thymidylate synthase
MDSYKRLVKKIINEGERKENRTGIDTVSITGYMFEHDMSEGFPLLTTKKMAYKSIFSELEFFLKGYHNKEWLKEHKNHIWDEWCSPIIQPYGNDEETKEKMKEISELGPIYGVQWRNFDGEFHFDETNEMHSDEFAKGVDQLKYVVDEIINNPTSRRIICSAWNPNQINAMALPPCHVMWQVLINTTTNKMDLIWYQRSVDTMLGLPFNIASYAALLELLCLESGKYTPGKLVGMLADVHIYVNHIEKALEQLDRPTYKLPTFSVKDFKSIFDFKSENVVISDYICGDKLNFDIAV